MPGMLDTVLNVGCTSAAVHGLVRMTGHPRFAWDCRRRFLESYASVVLGLEPGFFAGRLADMVGAEGVGSEPALDGEAFERLADSYLKMIEDEDCLVPEDPMEQLATAAQAVYRSWTSERARTYRRLEHLEDLQGTAVTVQAMVFGNRGLSSGAGVAFSRDPSTGAAQPVIDILFGRRAKTSYPAAAIRKPKKRSPVRFRRWRRNCVKRWRGSNASSTTCKTSSSRSRTANCGCCRRARPSARRRPRCGLPSTSSKRD